MNIGAVIYDGIRKKKFRYMIVTTTPASGKIVAPADVLFISSVIR